MAFSWPEEDKETLDPIVFVFARSIIAFLVVAVTREVYDRWWSPVQADRQESIGVRPLRSVSSGDKRAILLLSLVFIVNILSFFGGTDLTDAFTVAAFTCMLPVCIFITVRVFGIEPLSNAKILAILLVVLGNGVMVQIWTPIMDLLGSGAAMSSRKGTTFYVGCLLMVNACVTWSIFVGFQRPVLQRVRRLDYLVWFLAGGALIITTVGLCFRSSAIVRQLLSGSLSRWGWLAICFSGFFNATVPYYLIAFAVERGGPILVAAWSGAQPVLIALEAIVVLKEKATLFQMVGGSVTVIGILFTVYGQLEAPPSAPLFPEKASHEAVRADFLGEESPRHGDCDSELPANAP
jgi:drug/metabolite transporter (DMT)-like permease